MKPEEFKVGQVIVNTYVYPSSAGECQFRGKELIGKELIVEEVASKTITVYCKELEKRKCFAPGSIYADGCILIRDSKPTFTLPVKWKVQGSGEFSKLLLSLPIGNTHLYSGSSNQFYYCDNNEIVSWRPDTSNEFTVVTIEQLKDYYQSQVTEQREEKVKTYTIKVSDYKRIYSIACKSWKKKIQERFKELEPFAEEITFKDYEIKEMLLASLPEQRPIVEEVFREYVKDNEKIELKGFVNLYKNTGNVLGGVKNSIEDCDKNVRTHTERIGILDLSKIPEEAIIKI